MGAEPADIPALPQTKLEVMPTRTVYTPSPDQACRSRSLFMTAALPEDIDLLSRPVTYLTWEATATDVQKHTVSIYFDASSEIAVNTPDQPVTFQNADVARIKAWRVGSVEQPVLQKKGDDLRIDWGYFLYGDGQRQTLPFHCQFGSKRPRGFHCQWQLGQSRRRSVFAKQRAQ